MGWRAFFPWNTPVRFGHEGCGKFMPLSEVDFINSPNLPVPPPPPPLEERPITADQDLDDVQDESSDLLRSSISAEKDGIECPIHGKDIGPEVDLCVPPPSDDDEIDSRDGNPEDNDWIEKDRYPEVDVCIPPPSDDEADEENVFDGGGDEHEVDMCVPPPSDDDDDGEREETEEVESNLCAPYPVDEEYPYPNDGEIPYPDDVEYPVDDVYGYPVNDEVNDYATGEMAAVAPYPSEVVVGEAFDEEQNGKPDDKSSLPPVAEVKKKFHGDKAVVGFVPSHLRVKRNVSKLSQPKPKQLGPRMSCSQNETQGKYSVAGDYNKFMEEITELK